MAAFVAYFAGLNLTQIDHALFYAYDHRACARNRFAPTGFHVTEYDPAGRPEGDDLSGNDIVHKLSAKHFPISVN